MEQDELRKEASFRLWGDDTARGGVGLSIQLTALMTELEAAGT